MTNQDSKSLNACLEVPRFHRSVFVQLLATTTTKIEYLEHVKGIFQNLLFGQIDYNFENCGILKYLF